MSVEVGGIVVLGGVVGIPSVAVGAGSSVAELLGG